MGIQSDDDTPTRVRGDDNSLCNKTTQEVSRVPIVSRPIALNRNHERSEYGTKWHCFSANFQTFKKSLTPTWFFVGKVCIRFWWRKIYPRILSATVDLSFLADRLGTLYKNCQTEIKIYSGTAMTATKRSTLLMRGYYYWTTLRITTV